MSKTVIFNDTHYSLNIINPVYTALNVLVLHPTNSVLFGVDTDATYCTFYFFLSEDTGYTKPVLVLDSDHFAGAAEIRIYEMPNKEIHLRVSKFARQVPDLDMQEHVQYAVACKDILARIQQDVLCAVRMQDHVQHAIGFKELLAKINHYVEMARTILIERRLWRARRTILSNIDEFMKSSGRMQGHVQSTIASSDVMEGFDRFRMLFQIVQEDIQSAIACKDILARIQLDALTFVRMQGHAQSAIASKDILARIDKSVMIAQRMEEDVQSAIACKDTLARIPELEMLTVGSKVFAQFAIAEKDISTRMHLIERFSVKMEKLLRQVNVFHLQCNHLVQIFLKGIQEVKETYFMISRDMNLMWTLYESKKLSYLIRSLDSVLRDLMSADRLLQECGGKKWKRVAIVLSMPLPELEKYSGSRFLLLIRDFEWSHDRVRDSLHLPEAPFTFTGYEQTLSTKELEEMNSSLSRDQRNEEWRFDWCDYRCGYKLQKNRSASKPKVELHEDDDHQASECKDEIRVATDEAELHEDAIDQQVFGREDETGVAIDKEESLKGDFDRQTQDRKNLLNSLERNLIAHTHGNSLSLFPSQRIRNKFVADETSRNKFSAVVKNRCQYTSSSGSTDLISKCFEMDYSDLKLRKQISGGGFKHIYQANWLEQEVAVAMVERVPRDVVEKEAGFMVKLHHPNVVDFFGVAFKEENLTEEEKNSVEKIEPKWTGCLVMELMQEDLRSLIDKLLRGPKKQESGGPFSLSVTIDILLQIVAAMIHAQKFNVLHRDLKAKNCLVNPRRVPESEAKGVSTLYYTVKLIDFGESKLWSKDGKQTRKKGTTRWMAPEVWQSSEYSGSADVYSFGMTCYEIVTGYIPFQGIRHHVMERVVEGERPTIPGTVPQSLNDLMKECWTHAPDQRPTFKAIQELWAIKYSVDVQIG